MSRRIALVAALALAALFAIPAAAQAAVTLEEVRSEGASRVHEGKEIELVGASLLFSGPSFTVGCSSTELDGGVVENPGAAIKLYKGASSECSGLGYSWTAEWTNPPMMTVRAAGVSTLDMELKLNYYKSGFLVGTCTYKGNLHNNEYGLGEEAMEVALSAELTRVGGALPCPTNLTASGTLQAQVKEYSKVYKVRATDDGTTESSGLFTEAGSFYLPRTSPIKATSGSIEVVFKGSNGESRGKLECGATSLEGEVGGPDLLGFNKSSFSNCIFRGFAVSTVVGNMSAPWVVFLGEEEGRPETGLDNFSITATPYLFGSPLPSCTLEAEHINVSYPSETPLGLTLSETKLKIATPVGMCSPSQGVSSATLTSTTFTVDSGSHPVEFWES